jgi:site-specific DNA-methyltransferase (adenine-specific)
MQNTIIHGDCLDVMKKIPDHSVDLILADLPYGLKEHGGKYRFGPQSVKKGFRSAKQYENIGWDKRIFTKEYFDEIFRCSKNQVLFGMNYYMELLPSTKAFVVWHKKGNDKSSFAACELIWTSFNCAAKYFKYDWVGFGYINNPLKERKQHPTQKPLPLIEFLVKEFSFPSQTVLDCCIGSGTTAIACINTGRNYIGIEKEEKYVKIAEERIHALRRPPQDTAEAGSTCV